MEINTVKNFDSSLEHSLKTIFEAVAGPKGNKAEISSLKRINEQQAFATLAYEELKANNQKAADDFAKMLKTGVESYRKNHSKTINMFKVADRILRDLVRKGVIAREKYKSLKYSAFGKAQLDSDRTRLDTKKLPNTKDGDTPLRSLSTAIPKVKNNKEATNEEFEQFRSLEASISREKWKERKISGALNNAAASKEDEELPKAVKGTEGKEFLWKPASEKDGKLVVLLPQEISKKATKVELINPESKKIIESGTNFGLGNGGRLHFRFKKSGASYPKDVIVNITLKDGSNTQYVIKNPSEREVI